MSPWFAKAVIVVGSIAMVVIPHRQHGQRSLESKAVKSRVATPVFESYRVADLGIEAGLTSRPSPADRDRLNRAADLAARIIEDELLRSSRAASKGR